MLSDGNKRKLKEYWDSRCKSSERSGDIRIVDGNVVIDEVFSGGNTVQIAENCETCYHSHPATKTGSLTPPSGSDLLIAYTRPGTHVLLAPEGIYTYAKVGESNWIMEYYKQTPNRHPMPLNRYFRAKFEHCEASMDDYITLVREFLGFDIRFYAWDQSSNEQVSNKCLRSLKP